MNSERSSEPDPSAVVGAARRAFASGRTRPLDWRRAQLAGLRALIDENEERLVEALRADLGRSRHEALLLDLAPVTGECREALGSLGRWTREERVSTPLMLRPGRSSIVREPLGVVLIIAPWNYPVQLALSPLAGALAAGNAVVLKPSEISAHTSSALARLVPRYLDPEAVAVVEGGPAEVERLLAERFDHIFYTGGEQGARRVALAAAAQLTPITLELGGKSPCWVDASADLRIAARRIAWGKFLNAGQTCIAPDYVLVARGREEALLGELGQAVRDFYGADPRGSADYGRIASARHHARLGALLKGAEVALGGEQDAGERYFAPTIVKNVAADSPLMAEEIFGPILPVLPAEDLDAALRFVEARPKPLAFYVFAEERAVQERAVASASAGGICVNGTILHAANPNLPFGGVGASGMGAYHGRASFETFSHRKPVYRRSTWLDPSLFYPPYAPRLTAWLRRLL